MQVWMNGELVPAEEACVTVFDAGFQHGVGLFETMTALNGRIFRVHDHLDRLSASAEKLRLAEHLNTEALAEAAHLVVSENGLDAARVRLTVTGGDLACLQAGVRQHRPGVFIVAQPPTRYPEAYFDTGVLVTIADGRVSPLHPMAGHKTLNYWARIQSLQAASSHGAAETIWFSVSNQLASGAVSNIFLVKDGTLRTPCAQGEEELDALPAPVLPGITRGVIMELGEELGLSVTREELDIEDLLGAEEVFLTNSSWGILPVVHVEADRIGNGDVGAVTTLIRRARADLLERETGNPPGIRS